MKVGTLIFGGLACSLVVACSIDWTVIAPPHKNTEVGIEAESDSGTDAEDAASDTGSPNDGGVPDPDVADGSDAAVGCSPNAPCPNAMVCTYADHFCGEGADAGGTCVEQANCAGAPTQTVCGCDGEVYLSRCAATAAGTDTSATIPPRCSTPSNMFRCGDVFCGNTDACVEKSDGTYACKAMNGCALGCACLDILVPCLLHGTCGTDKSGHLVIKCE